MTIAGVISAAGRIASGLDDCHKMRNSLIQYARPNGFDIEKKPRIAL